MLFEDADSFAVFAYQRYAGFQASACNFIVRLSLIRQNHLRFYKADFWEDMVFTLNLVTLAERAVLLPDITYTYLCRENSLSNSWHYDIICKETIVNFFKAVDLLKGEKDRYIQKSYYPNRCNIALMSDFYIVCNVLKKSKYIVPSFTDEELHQFMKHPATISEILQFKQLRIRNLFLFIIGKMPSFLCLLIIKLLAKIKSL